MNNKDLEKYKLPDVPGVYFFKKGKDILYIGKATSLRDRTKSYFAKDLIATRGAHIVDMVFKADSIEWQETDSVLEALILEANLIKKYQPYYNTKEKDDKSWNYVCVTKDSLPQILTVRGKDIAESKALYRASYGPFTSGSQLKAALKIVRKIFPYIDKSSIRRDNYEFYRQLGLTPDVSSTEAQKAYAKNVHNIELFFSGKKKTIQKALEKDMRAYAKAKRFEDAARVRNQLFALGHINDVALITEDGTHQDARKAKARVRIEAYDVAHMSGTNMVGVMTVIEDGEVVKKEYRTFNIRGFTKIIKARASPNI
jgi:excinuclease ABC subunit C